MIIISDGRIIIDTSIDSSGAEKDAKGLSSKLGSMASGVSGTVTKVAAGMVTAATGVVATLTTLSVKQYAEYEQLVGGVETLFKDSSSQVMDYANNAFMTAGLSANEYMDTVTKFSASLLQGLGGDTKKAAEIGNKAVTDMSDNANKMGTAIDDIQNAYQGFSKANYTMLDNLRLGYGGTKEEMQRLLADAEKLSGIKYDISNFSDIIEAIHVVQTEIGITGTTAKEASSTISGSLSMTKSAWTNLLTGMADDNANFDVLVDNLVNSVGKLAENLLPRIKIAINGITKLFNSLAKELPSLINSILPDLLNSGIDVVKNLVSGIQAGLPSLMNMVLGIMMSLVNGLIEVLPMLLEVGLQAIIALGQGIAEALPTLIPTIVDLIISMCDTIIENLPMLIDVAIDIILALVEGLINALPTLIENVPRIINSFAEAIYDNLPKILEMGIEIIVMLIKGLIESIPLLIDNLPQIIMAIINAFTLINWWDLGSNLIKNIGEGIKSMVGNLGNTAKNLASNAWETIKGIFSNGNSLGSNFISFISNGIRSMVGNVVGTVRDLGSSIVNAIRNVFSNGASIGSNLIRGIWNGISNMTGWIINLIGGFADSVVSSIKGFFGIHSPSKLMQDEVGIYLAQGIGVGFDEETPNLEKDIDTNISDLVAKMQGTVDYETSMTTAKVVSRNNSLSGGVDDNSDTTKDNPLTVIAKLIVDGKEFTQEVVAPNQDVLNEYYEGR